MTIMLHFDLLYLPSVSKLSRYLIINLRMSADRIVKHLDVLKLYSLDLRSRFESIVMQIRRLLRCRRSFPSARYTR
jgi:hypothetical protein